MSNTQNAAVTWNATLGQLQLLVTPANFETWLRDTIGLRHEDDRFVVGAQSDFATEWLSTKLRPLISRTLAKVLGYATDVIFEVVRPFAPDAPPALLTLEEATATATLVPEMYRKQAPPPPDVSAALTFETFVVGDENRMAFEAARAAASGGLDAKPLLIFGASGLGKTHLLNAIAHTAHAAGRRVVYATAERFGNDYVRALTGRDLDGFRRRYRTCDLLLLDDVQFLAGKEKFQDEFFHAFNELHGAGKQIIISADRAPSKLDGLTEALRSRLQWGLAADLLVPRFETRLAILRAKAGQQAMRLNDDALVSIASHTCPSVRELEGYLNRVIAYVPMVGGIVTPEIVERALRPLASAAERAALAGEPPSAETIVNAVCHRTGTSPGDLRGRSRARDVSYARHLAMYILKEDGQRTIAEICRLLGHRDHSTVLGGIKRVTQEQKVRAETRDDMEAVRAELATAALAEVG